MKFLRNPWFWCLWAGLIAIALIWSAYRLNWPETGFQGKTVWDWLSLLVIPVALALVALFFNQVNTRTERQIAQQRYERDKDAAEKRYERDQEIAKQRYEQEQKIALDKQREELFQTYLDCMSGLLLDKDLRKSQIDAEVRNVARARTISVLLQLDPRRVENVFTFLLEAKLIGSIVSLSGANFSQIDWRKADLGRTTLSRIDFAGANLSGVNFIAANLNKTDFRESNLSDAFFFQANLQDADFFEANLSKASFEEANLSKASFIGTNLRNAKLNKANLSEASFFQADLTNADLTDINFSDVSIEKTILKNAKIDKSQLTPEQIAQAIWD